MDESELIEPGDFILTTIDNPLVNALVRACQAFTGDWSRFTHAAIYVGGDDRCVIELAPSGVAVRTLEEFAGRPVSVSCWPLTETRRFDIVSEAWDLHRRNVQYAWLVYPALALARIGIRPKWLLEYLERCNKMICSQAVDHCYRAAGVHMFTDGRPASMVTPGDLTYTLSRPKRT
jgi:hypothetical protein